MFDRRHFLQGAAVIPALTVAANDTAAQGLSMPKRYDVPPTINPELAAHGAIFERRIHKVGDNVYSAVGWSTCNSVMIEGSDGVIIVDAGDSAVAAREVLAEFRKITAKPVRAVIYTCFHIDHIAGVKGFASAEDVAAGRVAIIAHDTLLANVSTQGGSIAPILGIRTAYNFGVILGEADVAGMNLGTAPLPRKDREVTFIAPTKTFGSTIDLTIAGVEMKLMHAPSESPDEIVVFLPRSGILLSSEVIPAQCFPTLHPLRGEAYRDPVQWYRSIDLMRRLGAEAMVPAHGVPVLGAAAVEEVLRHVRDAIQFIHDQTVRQMNKGLTPDELALAVRLPPHLAAYKPWMQELFGTVSQAVRAVYQGYLGWFDGDPAALAPIERIERARREVALMGGRERVLAAADKALADGDAQWAAELATRLVRIDKEDAAARALKAAAFRRLGYASLNAIWRNWYLSAARELEGFDIAAFRRTTARGGLAAPDLLAALPARAFVDGLMTRLKAEDTVDVTMTVGFRFPDIDEAYAVRLRRGVAEIDDRLPERADLTLTLDRPALDAIRSGRLALRDAIANGAIRLSDGPQAAAERFFGYFEPPGGAIQLVMR